MVNTEQQQQKILIVEDQVDAQAWLRDNATAIGFDAEICSSGEAAWALFNNDCYRLVIIEWNLPADTSRTLCRQIKSSPVGGYCTILMIANQVNSIDQTTALMAGACYCMDQPVMTSQIADWLAIAKRSMSERLAIEQTVKSIDRYKLELEDVNSQLEGSIEHANQLAMDAERAYIEVNQIFKTVAGGIALVNNDFEIIRNNETFLKMANTTADQVKSRKCYEAFHSTLCNTPECPLTRINNGEKRVESQIEKQDINGETIYYSIVSTPFRGLVGELLGMVEHITDITTKVKAEILLKESESRYKELSIVDELTGLFNKRHFNETLRNETDRSRRYNRPLSMIIMDIDNFKHFNDTFGHAEGDKVLSVMGKIITQSIRTIDRGNRYGGEEFTVILPDTTAEEAIFVAERIRQTFAATDFFPQQGEKVNKTVSLGITQFLTEDTPNSLIKRADRNLYQAKESGKNCYVLT
ncbi:MAG: diguanylate cyclase [Proteobacteria bacterium]|nr:diguanylate cyclase [Desulfobulbaceae bacterium]MBU4151523.1 diguanylate cyclase [Pseudomonadota bacterium]